MRRTILCLFLAMAMYGVYMYTLPAGTSQETAMASGEAQVNSQITLPAKTLYAVVLGVYDTEEEARPDAAEYALRGAAGTITETNDGWALLGAGYRTEGEAASVCAQLRSGEGINAQMMLFSADEVHISLTATQTQTEAIASALDLLDDMPDMLMQFAAQLDRGDMNTATARTLVAAALTEAESARDTLSTAIGTTSDIFSRLTETEIMEFCDTMKLIAADDGPRGLSFSSWLKQCSLETELGVIGLMNILNR